MLAILCLLLLAYFPNHQVHASRPHHKNVVLLAGQSNMSGRGGIVNQTWDGVIPLNCQPNVSILRLAANLTWVEARDPLHKDIDINATCGIGPGMSFAHSLLKKNPGFKQVALVPCAVGSRMGTKLSEWAPGTFLYNQLMTRARAARRGGGRIRALLWYQGESDTVLVEDANSYKTRLETFFTQLRADLVSLEDANSYKTRLETFFTQLRADLVSPKLPIIQVALASGQGAFIEKVREAQLGMKLTNVRCVDAKQLGLLPDKLHLSTSGQVKLGEMLAQAFLQMIPSPIHHNVSP